MDDFERKYRKAWNILFRDPKHKLKPDNQYQNWTYLETKKWQSPAMRHYYSTRDNKDYIIFVEWIPQRNIYFYDIQNDSFTKLNNTQGPDELCNLDETGCIMLDDTNLLILSGMGQNKIIFNLEHKTWTVNKCDLHDALPATMGSTQFIHMRPTNEIHIMSSQHTWGFQSEMNSVNIAVKSHYVYNTETKIIDLVKDTIANTYHSNNFYLYSRFLYAPTTNQIITFGGVDKNTLGRGQSQTVNDILCCDVDNKDKHGNYQWKQYPIKMKSRCNPICVLAFDHIAIIFDGKRGHVSQYGDIWCLDLVSQKMYKSDIVYRKKFNVVFVTNDNEYLIGNGSIYDKSCNSFINYLLKIPLNTLLPKSLITKYKIKYKLLINGYSHGVEKEGLSQMMPHNLRIMILQYFTKWL
eukprot:167971_1